MDFVGTEAKFTGYIVTYDLEKIDVEAGVQSYQGRYVYLCTGRYSLSSGF